MEYIDLTHKIKNELSEYPGDPKTKLNYFKKADETDSSTLLKLETGLHTGTHMDSPFHYIINGKKISQLPLKNFIGKASINYVESKSKEILVKNCLHTDKDQVLKDDALFLTCVSALAELIPIRESKIKKY